MLSRVLNRETEKSHILLPPLAFSGEKENYPEASKQFHTPTNSTNPVSLRCATSSEKASYLETSKQQLDTPANHMHTNVVPVNDKSSPIPLSLVQCHGITINYNFGD